RDRPKDPRPASGARSVAVDSRGRDRPYLSASAKIREGYQPGLGRTAAEDRGSAQYPGDVLLWRRRRGPTAAQARGGRPDARIPADQGRGAADARLFGDLVTHDQIRARDVGGGPAREGTAVEVTGPKRWDRLSRSCAIRTAGRSDHA